MPNYKLKSITVPDVEQPTEARMLLQGSQGCPDWIVRVRPDETPVFITDGFIEHLEVPEEIRQLAQFHQPKALAALKAVMGVVLGEEWTGAPEPTPAERTRAATKLIEKWLDEEEPDDEEAWDNLKAALNRNRELSGDYRKLFEE